MSVLAEDYALIADKKGEMLIMQVVHKKTGVVIHTKRKRAINNLHIKSVLRHYRRELFEEQGLEQLLLEDLARRHKINVEGKSLKEILDEINDSQNRKNYLFDL